jgi:hypothetical protein
MVDVCSHCLKHNGVAINLVCLALFTYTMVQLVILYIDPTELNTVIVKKSLTDMTFPLIFKLCIKPGYDVAVLGESGYEEVYKYFKGEVPTKEDPQNPTIGSSSFVGWSGSDGQGNATGAVTCVQIRLLPENWEKPFYGVWHHS